MTRPIAFVHRSFRRLFARDASADRTVATLPPPQNQPAIILDYPIKPLRRWTEERPHEPTRRALEVAEHSYRQVLTSAMSHISAFRRAPSSNIAPAWSNGWFPPLDAIVLYAMIASHRPTNYIEIGSGNSTMIARWAIRDLDLKTNVLSIDPNPRVEITDLCDDQILKPLEDVELDTFDRLEAGDFLFMDGSHRVFENSDSTAFFLDVLPRVVPGTVVHIHDIHLPFDYDQGWENRYYSEQYLLAAALIAGNWLSPIFASRYASVYLADEVNELLAAAEVPHESRIGTAGSFWATTQSSRLRT